MARFVDHVADAWAQWWSSDDSPAARVYARNVEWWDVGRGRATEIHGRDALEGTRAARRAHTDGFWVDVRRVIPGEDVVATEFVAVARECGAPVAAPGCAWWWIDDDGRIAREHWYWRWGDREPSTPAVAGHPGRGAPGSRPPGWFRGFAERFVASWDASPVATVDAFYAPEAVADTMGAGEDGVQRGSAAVRGAQAQLAAMFPERRSTIGAIAGSATCVAFTQLASVRTTDDAARTIPVTHVLVVDAADRVTSDHAYVLPAWRRSDRG